LGLPYTTAPHISSLFEGNEVHRAERLLSLLAEGKSLALVSEAGTPAISDPGQHVIRQVLEGGGKVSVLPGPCAAVVGLVASGLPTDRFLFVGFLPKQQGKRQQELGQLAGQTATLVFYESPERVGKALADMVLSFGAGRSAALCREMTKMYEESVRGTLSELAARYASEAPRGECVLVVEGRDAAAKGEVLDVEAEVRALLADGLSPKDIAGRLVVRTGLSRRDLYQLALSLARHPGG